MGRMKTIAVVGGGSFGTAAAQHLATMSGADGRRIVICTRSAERARAISATRRNPDYLGDVELAGSIEAVGGDGALDEAVERADGLVLAIPAQAMSSILERVARASDGGRGLHLLNLAKGIDISTGAFMHALAERFVPHAAWSALSGPSHAEELSRGMPTAVVVASRDHDEAVAWQTEMNDDRLRVYTSADVVGVELGGAMKNVIAIAAGIARAAGAGDNSTAALVTRGLAEIMRCGAALGADPLTLAGLAGIGDLMVTCYSRLSRNFRFGLEIGAGRTPDEAAAAIGQVVEGMHTVRALHAIARSVGASLPITEGVHAILCEGAGVRSVMSSLLKRDPKREAG